MASPDSEKHRIPSAILEGIARGEPLRNSLADIAAEVQKEFSPTVICSFYIQAPPLSESFSHVFSSEYADVEKLLQSSQEAGEACPWIWALAHQDQLIVPEIHADPRWLHASWRERLKAFSLHSCLALPIFDTAGMPIGIYMLWSTGGLPFTLETITSSAPALHLAAIAIDKKRGERVQRDYESRLQLAVQSADLGTWEWDLSSGVLTWSDRCKAMFGYGPDMEMTYDRFLSAIHPADRDRVDHAVRHAIETGELYHVELRSLWDDGTLRWISSTGRSYGENSGGRPSHMRGIALDITQRKEAEIQATASAERFQFLAESLPEKIFTASAEGEISYMNAQWATYTGYSIDDVKRMGWREFVHPEDLEEKSARWKHAIKAGTAFEFEHRFRRADGMYRWHLSRAQPMRHPDGHVLLWLGSNTDVDDLKRAQFALRESESRSRLAMEAAGLGFWDWDILTNRVKWSPEHNRLFGLPVSEEEGHIDIAMARIHPEDRPRIQESLKRATTEKIDYEAEFRTLCEDGGSRWISAHGRAYYDDETGRAERMIGVVRDVTERRKFEDQLRRHQQEIQSALSAAELARDEAETASRAKDQFLAVLSHELRTPLTPVLMAVSSIRRLQNSSPEITEALAMIQRNIQIEARLIEDLLDLTRITRNKMELKMEAMDIHLAVRQAIEVCTTDLEEKKHDLKVDLGAENSQVCGDFARLQQVFWNLIKNAVKFTPEGGVISIRSFSKPGHICIEISDSGLGIPPEVLPRIFNPFEQGDQSFVRRFGGLGLGLAISQATIQAHQGDLSAKSAGPDQGATFSVELATQSPA